MRFVTIILLLAVLSSCSSQKQYSVKATVLIPEAFQDFTQEKCPSGNFILLTKNEAPNKTHVSNVLKIAILDTGSKQISYETEVLEGKANWVDNEIVKISFVPGNVSVEELNASNWFFVDAATGKKVNALRVIENEKN